MDFHFFFSLSLIQLAKSFDLKDLIIPFGLFQGIRSCCCIICCNNPQTTEGEVPGLCLTTDTWRTQIYRFTHNHVYMNCISYVLYTLSTLCLGMPWASLRSKHCLSSSFMNAHLSEWIWMIRVEKRIRSEMTEKEKKEKSGRVYVFVCEREKE